jgi:hypothetical protein
MIKAGDKVICIKLDYMTSDGILHQLDFSIGEIYVVGSANNLIAIRGYGWAFGINDSNCIREFKDYFITLAEWREQQINSILND